MIVMSEIGDKTFLIAAIMSMTHGRWTVFFASLSALALMTVLSTGFGLVFPHFFSKTVTKWIAAVLFAVLGLKMVADGVKMSSNQLQEEYEQVASELDADPGVSPLAQKAGHMESAVSISSSKSTAIAIDPIFYKIATLTFVAEWGDRSQIATIALAAAQNAVGVTMGAVAGHAVCTLMAVVCGQILSRWVSIKTVTISGGFMFVVFSVFTALGLM